MSDCTDIAFDTGRATEGEAHIDAKDLAGLAWGRVAEVANVFTQEVSKVWANGLAPLGGHADGVEHPGGSSSSQGTQVCIR